MCQMLNFHQKDFYQAFDHSLSNDCVALISYFKLKDSKFICSFLLRYDERFSPEIRRLLDSSSSFLRNSWIESKLDLLSSGMRKNVRLILTVGAVFLIVILICSIVVSINNRQSSSSSPSSSTGLLMSS